MRPVKDSGREISLDFLRDQTESSRSGKILCCSAASSRVELLHTTDVKRMELISHETG